MSGQRTGYFKPGLQGYMTFVPSKLPPEPRINLLDSELACLLSKADRAIARLDGASTILPNVNNFIRMFSRHEAVLSSQIEGTQTSLENLLEYEAKRLPKGQTDDATETLNYVEAMHHGLQRIKTLPLSKRLMLELHEILMKNSVRGSQHPGGAFRREQNYVGASDAGIRAASFVPPSVEDMYPALENLEEFMNERNSNIPELIHCGIVHGQFETIHPFPDGNGRISRLLITLFLCERGIMEKPLLYLSYFLKANQVEYYEKLNAIRFRADWEGWLKFFLRGIIEVAEQASQRARQIIEMKEQHLLLISNKLKTRASQRINLLEFLSDTPVLDAQMVQRHHGVSLKTAHSMLEDLISLGIVAEVTGASRNRIYIYQAYLRLFHSPLSI